MKHSFYKEKRKKTKLIYGHVTSHNTPVHAWDHPLRYFAYTNKHPLSFFTHYWARSHRLRVRFSRRARADCCVQTNFHFRFFMHEWFRRR